MDEQLYEQLKRYRNRQMPTLEQEEFETRLNNDPELAEAAGTWAAIQVGIQEKGDAELDRQLMEMGRQLLQADETTSPLSQPEAGPKHPAKRIAMPRWAYAAAAVFLLLLIALPLYQKVVNRENTFASKIFGPKNRYAAAETLFQENFNMPPVQTVRDAGTNAWQQAYTQKQYPAAIAELERLLADSNYKNRGEAYLYLGITQLATEQPQPALEALQHVGSDDFQWEEAQWYQALAYLKLNDSNAAKTILQNLAGQSSGEMQEKAKNLLHRLK